MKDYAIVPTTLPDVLAWEGQQALTTLKRKGFEVTPIKAWPLKKDRVSGTWRVIRVTQIGPKAVKLVLAPEVQV